MKAPQIDSMTFLIVVVKFRALNHTVIMDEMKIGAGGSWESSYCDEQHTGKKQVKLEKSYRQKVIMITYENF